MKLFWLSWNEHADDYRPIGFPPNEAVLGWWKSGESSGEPNGYSTICAYVEAANEDSAWVAVDKDWPLRVCPDDGTEDRKVRFCDEKPRIILSDRFAPNDWMVPRLAKWREVK